MNHDDAPPARPGEEWVSTAEFIELELARITAEFFASVREDYPGADQSALYVAIAAKVARVCRPILEAHTDRMVAANQGQIH